MSFYFYFLPSFIFVHFPFIFSLYYVVVHLIYAFFFFSSSFVFHCWLRNSRNYFCLDWKATQFPCWIWCYCGDTEGALLRMFQNCRTALCYRITSWPSWPQPRSVTTPLRTKNWNRMHLPRCLLCLWVSIISDVRSTVTKICTAQIVQMLRERWINGWMDGRMAGGRLWIDGWMDEWLEGEFG